MNGCSKNIKIITKGEIQMHDTNELSFEDLQRIKREYDEATPWRYVAFGICTIGVYVMSLLTMLIK